MAFKRIDVSYLLTNQYRRTKLSNLILGPAAHRVETSGHDCIAGYFPWRDSAGTLLPFLVSVPRNEITRVKAAMVPVEEYRNQCTADREWWCLRYGAKHKIAGGRYSDGTRNAHLGEGRWPARIRAALRLECVREVQRDHHWCKVVAPILILVQRFGLHFSTPELLYETCQTLTGLQSRYGNESVLRLVARQFNRSRADGDALAGALTEWNS